MIEFQRLDFIFLYSASSYVLSLSVSRSPASFITSWAGVKRNLVVNCICGESPKVQMALGVMSYTLYWVLIGPGVKTCRVQRLRPLCRLRTGSQIEISRNKSSRRHLEWDPDALVLPPFSCLAVVQLTNLSSPLLANVLARLFSNYGQHQIDHASTRRSWKRHWLQYLASKYSIRNCYA